MKKSKRFSAPFADKDQFKSDKLSAPTIDILERSVRFSLKHCEIGRNYCISKAASDKEVLRDLYNRLGYFEDMTWRVAQSANHKSGISIEKRKSANYKSMAASYPDFDTFGHLRVPSKKKPIFRVFGARREDLFYILRFDVDGSINH